MNNIMINCVDCIVKIILKIKKNKLQIIIIVMIQSCQMAKYLITFEIPVRADSVPIIPIIETVISSDL